MKLHKTLNGPVAQPGRILDSTLLTVKKIIHRPGLMILADYRSGNRFEYGTCGGEFDFFDPRFMRKPQ